jgi:hypothetical protein
MAQRVALMVARLQPLHKGHTRIINAMIEDFDKVIVGLGSTGRHSEPSNPWTQVQRQQMLRNVYGNRINIVPLQDLGATQGGNDWCDYVLDKCAGMKLPEITDYFTGSYADATWYKGRFAAEDLSLNEVADPQIYSNFHTEEGLFCRLHVMERANNPVPSATELRTFLTTRSDAWREWIPAVNHELVESTYPERFKVVQE